MRTEQTAHNIQYGLNSHTKNAKLIGLFNSPQGYIRENLLRYIARERELGNENPVRSFFNNWIGGRYPPDEIIPLIDFGIQIAEMCMKNLESANA